MIDFILNIKSLKHETLIVSGKATTNHRDRHGESITISPNAFKKAIKTFIENGGPIMVDHGQNKKYGSAIVGKVINAEYSPTNYSIDSPEPLQMSIDVLVEITHPELIQSILNKEINAFSLNWKTTQWLINPKTNQRIDTDVIFNELTVTSNPANPYARFHIVTDDDILKQYKIGQEVKVYDNIANIKNIYINDDKQYFVDLLFNDNILNLKTANKVPLQDIQEVSKKILTIEENTEHNQKNIFNSMYSKIKEAITAIINYQIDEVFIPYIKLLSDTHSECEVLLTRENKWVTFIITLTETGEVIANLQAPKKSETYEYKQIDKIEKSQDDAITNDVKLSSVENSKAIIDDEQQDNPNSIKEVESEQQPVNEQPINTEDKENDKELNDENVDNIELDNNNHVATENSKTKDSTPFYGSYADIIELNTTQFM